MAAKSGKKTAAKKTKKKAVAKKPATKKAASKPAQAKASKKAPSKATKKAKTSKKAEKKSTVKSVLNKVAAVLKPKKEAKKAGKKAETAAATTPEPKVAKKGRKGAAESEGKVAVQEIQAAAAEVVAPEDEEIVLTDAEGRRYCRAAECDQLSLVDGYCRYHYLLFWKKIQNRKKILAGGKLERYIEELTSRYADKFLEMLRKDLRSEKDFLLAIQELELDEDASGSEEQEEEETKTYLEEIRGISSEESSAADDDY